jgi:hypothetical protein
MEQTSTIESVARQTCQRMSPLLPLKCARAEFVSPETAEIGASPALAEASRRGRTYRNLNARKRAMRRRFRYDSSGASSKESEAP